MASVIEVKMNSVMEILTDDPPLAFYDGTLMDNTNTTAFITVTNQDQAITFPFTAMTWVPTTSQLKGHYYYPVPSSAFSPLDKSWVFTVVVYPLSGPGPGVLPIRTFVIPGPKSKTP